MADKKSYCNNCKANGVETEIIWNQNNRSKPSEKYPQGAMIPMEVGGQNHTCPFRPKWGNSPAKTTAPTDVNAPAREVNIAAKTTDEAAAQKRIESDLQRIKDTLIRIEQTLAGLLLEKKA